MSLPRLWRRTAVKWCSTRTFWKASIAFGSGALNGEPGNSLKAMRLNLQRRPPKVFTRSRASAGESFTPAMRMYSKVMRRRLGMG